MARENLKEGQVQDSENNGMTEVALALAMAFLAIMVLAIVSMAVPQMTSQQNGLTSGLDLTLPDEEPIDIRSAKTPSADRGSSVGADRRDQRVDDTYIMFFADRFYSAQGQLLDPDKVTGDRPAVLAVNPDLSMSDTLAAKSQINIPELRITLLNKEWIDYLENLR